MPEETQIAKVEDARVTYNVFFVGPEGFGEHLQVKAESTKPIIEGRAQLVEWLKLTGAKPQPRDIPFASKQQAPRPDQNGGTVDPMLKAAQQVLGASVGRTCARHGTPMKRIGGTAEHGRLSQNGKPYNAFWVCEAAPGCRGE